MDAADFALAGGSPVGGTYSGTGVAAGNFSPATAGTGTHTITYTYTDGNGCVNSATSDITVNALPVTSAITGNTTPACSATGESYNVTLTAGSSYSWSVPVGASITSGAIGPDNNAITVDFGGTNGDIRVIETSADGCSASAVTLTIS